MRQHSKFLVLFSVLGIILILLGGIRAYAAPVYTIEYDKDAQKLIQSSGNPFSELNDLMPGDSKTVSIELKNSALTDRELKFYPYFKDTATNEQKELMSKINLDVSVIYNDKTNNIYSGQMIDINKTEPSPVTLIKLPAGKSALFQATISVPAEFDNKYADFKIPILWKFYVSDSGLKVDTPIANPIGDTYDDSQLVELTCSTDGATIYYTTDGKTPTKKSSIYTNKIKVDRNTVIKAYAVKEEYEDSDIMNEEYKIKCSAPIINPKSGTYDDAQVITITSTTQNANIYYTTDGSAPSEKSMLYTKPFTVDKNTAVKAITIKEGLENSSVSSEVYKIKCAPPIANPKSGEFVNSVSVKLTTKTVSGQIYYTLDGSTPTNKSKLYEGPIDITSNTILKAITVKDNCENSQVITEQYSIKCEPPAITPKSGEYLSSQTITISSKTPDSKIYYTIDGSTPDKNSLLYTKPFIVDKNTTVKAIAIKENCINSDVISETYTIKCAPPVITPKSGTYDRSQEITINSETPNSTIYYTVDGRIPNKNSLKYTTPFTVDTNTTVKAITIKESCVDSSVVSETYKIKSNSPVITPESGQYPDKVEVTIKSDEPGSEIYYTTDGSTPDEKSDKYEGPFTVDKETTITAISVAPNKEPSDSTSEKYTIKLNPPTIKPASGTFTERASIVIVHDLPDVEIRYTVDGSEPTKDSPLYTDAFEITKDTIVIAKAFKEKTIESDKTSESYKIEVPINNLEPPTINPKSGTYKEKIQVVITHPSPNVIIRYTVTGEEPTEDSPIYNGPFEIDNNTSVSAKAYPVDGNKVNPSVSVTETYKFILHPPVITPAGGTYEEKVEVIISHPEKDVIIRYTTDGSEPDENSPEYKKSLIVDKSTTVTAKAFSYTKLPSEPISEEYIIQAGKPDITPEGGEYPDKVIVTIQHPDDRAEIHYTIDGTIPDENSPIYKGPFEVISNLTVNAIAIIPDTIPSKPATEDYIIKLSPPDIRPEGNTFTEKVHVQITHNDPDVIIRYTVDGTIPNETSPIYTGPFDITKNSIVTAISTKNTNANSDPVSEKYDIKVATPEISPDGKEFEYGESVMVKITCTTPNSVIYYTTDGSIPTRDSFKYVDEFIVDKDCVITAIAVCDDMIDSDSAFEEYTFCEEGQVSKPKASPSGGIFDDGTKIKITCSTPGATIYYTLDGKNPTKNSKVYTKPIYVDEYTVIKAIAVKDGMKDSHIMKEEYEFMVATPMATPAGGNYSEVQYVILTCETDDVTIYYTIDGSEPSENSLRYNGQIKIDEDVVLKAFAVKDGWIDSDIMTEIYKIDIPEVIPEEVDITTTEPPKPTEPEPIKPNEPTKTGVPYTPSHSNRNMILIIGTSIILIGTLVRKKNH